MKKATAILMILLMIFLLVSCESKDYSKYAGVYKISRVTYAGKSYTPAEFKKLTHKSIDNIQIELKKNGRYTASGCGVNGSGKFDIESNKIIFDNDSLTGTISTSGSMTLKESGVTFTLRRSK